MRGAALSWMLHHLRPGGYSAIVRQSYLICGGVDSPFAYQYGRHIHEYCCLFRELSCMLSVLEGAHCETKKDNKTRHYQQGSKHVDSACGEGVTCTRSTRYFEKTEKPTHICR